MPKGGKREGAGRKSTWPSGCKFLDTKIIRVPAYLSDELLEIAKRLDAGEKIEFVTKSEPPATDLDTKSEEMVIDVESEIVTESIDTASDLVTVLENVSTEIENEIVTDSLLGSETISDKEKIDLVTDSKDGSIQGTLDLVTESDLPEIPGKLLAFRLGVSRPELSTQKKRYTSSRSLFYDWIQSKDPDDIRWVGVGNWKRLRGYKPEKGISNELVTKLRQWINSSS